MEVTKTSDLKKIKDGEVVELPKFDDGTPFIAKLRRPSLLYLCKSGAIPNELLAAAQEIFEGRQKGNIKNYADVLDKVLEVALVEPKYEEVAELLTDVQRLAIFSYTQNGVMGLQPFRKIEELSKIGGRSKK